MSVERCNICDEYFCESCGDIDLVDYIDEDGDEQEEWLCSECEEEVKSISHLIKCNNCGETNLITNVKYNICKECMTKEGTEHLKVKWCD